MCDVKKLCTCQRVYKRQDHWKLEFHCGYSPSFGEVVPTRPEHRHIAEEIANDGPQFMGPLPMPLFRDLFVGLADISQMEKAVEAEVEWLNSGNPFDFDYEPFDEDRLMFCIGGEEIAFSFSGGAWVHQPHQAYSVDHRMQIDAESADLGARDRARQHLEKLKS